MVRPNHQQQPRVGQTSLLVAFAIGVVIPVALLSLQNDQKHQSFPSAQVTSISNMVTQASLVHVAHTPGNHRHHTNHMRVKTKTTMSHFSTWLCDIPDNQTESLSYDWICAEGRYLHDATFQLGVLMLSFLGMQQPRDFTAPSKNDLKCAREFGNHLFFDEDLRSYWIEDKNKLYNDPKVDVKQPMRVSHVLNEQPLCRVCVPECMNTLPDVEEEIEPACMAACTHAHKSDTALRACWVCLHWRHSVHTSVGQQETEENNNLNKNKINKSPDILHLLWPMGILDYVINALQTLANNPTALRSLFDPSTEGLTTDTHKRKMSNKHRGDKSVGNFSSKVLSELITSAVKQQLIGLSDSGADSPDTILPSISSSLFDAGGGGGVGIDVRCEGVLRFSLGGGGGIGISQQLQQNQISQERQSRENGNSKSDRVRMQSLKNDDRNIKSSVKGSKNSGIDSRNNAAGVDVGVDGSDTSTAGVWHVTSGAGFGAGVQVFNVRGKKVMSIGGGGGASETLECTQLLPVSKSRSCFPRISKTSGSTVDTDAFLDWENVHWSRKNMSNKSDFRPNEVDKAAKNLIHELQGDLKSCLQRGQLEVVGSGSMGSGVNYHVPITPDEEGETKSRNGGTGSGGYGKRSAVFGDVMMGMRLLPSVCSFGCARPRSILSAQENTTTHIPETSNANGTCEYRQLPSVIESCQRSCATHSNEKTTKEATRDGNIGDVRTVYRKCECPCQRKGFGVLGCEWASWMSCRL